MSKKSKVHQEEAAPVQVFDPSVMVRLVSCDDHVFFCDRNCVKISQLMKHCLLQEKSAPLDTSDACFLEEPATDGSVAGIRFRFVNAEKLEKGLRFVHMKYRFDTDAPDHRPPMPSGTSVQDQLELLALAVLLQI